MLKCDDYSLLLCWYGNVGIVDIWCWYCRWSPCWSCCYSVFIPIVRSRCCSGAFVCSWVPSRWSSFDVTFVFIRFTLRCSFTLRWLLMFVTLLSPRSLCLHVCVWLHHYTRISRYVHTLVPISLVWVCTLSSTRLVRSLDFLTVTHVYLSRSFTFTHTRSFSVCSSFLVHAFLVVPRFSLDPHVRLIYVPRSSVHYHTHLVLHTLWVWVCGFLHCVLPAWIAWVHCQPHTTFRLHTFPRSWVSRFRHSSSLPHSHSLPSSHSWTWVPWNWVGMGTGGASIQPASPAQPHSLAHSMSLTDHCWLKFGIQLGGGNIPKLFRNPEENPTNRKEQGFGFLHTCTHHSFCHTGLSFPHRSISLGFRSHTGYPYTHVPSTFGCVWDFSAVSHFTAFGLVSHTSFYTRSHGLRFTPSGHTASSCRSARFTTQVPPLHTGWIHTGFSRLVYTAPGSATFLVRSFRYVSDLRCFVCSSAFPHVYVRLRSVFDFVSFAFLVCSVSRFLCTPPRWIVTFRWSFTFTVFTLCTFLFGFSQFGLTATRSSSLFRLFIIDFVRWFVFKPSDTMRPSFDHCWLKAHYRSFR